MLKQGKPSWQQLAKLASLQERIAKIEKQLSDSVLREFTPAELRELRAQQLAIRIVYEEVWDDTTPTGGDAA